MTDEKFPIEIEAKGLKAILNRLEELEKTFKKHHHCEKCGKNGTAIFNGHKLCSLHFKERNGRRN